MRVFDVIKLSIIFKDKRLLLIVYMNCEDDCLVLILSGLS